MKSITIDKPFASEEEYFAFEERSELRHELINNNLFEMSGISKFHNKIVLRFLLLLGKFINEQEYMVAFEDYKVRTHEGNFFYPDVMVCEADPAKYYAENPVFIVEVLSESTRKFDLVDKFIQYQKCNSLQYYLCVEPEQQVVIFYFKTEEGEWLTETYTQLSDAIELKQLSVSITLQDIYQPS